MANDYFKDLRLDTDEVILNFLAGKKQMPYIGDQLFTPVPVSLRDGKIATSNVEDYVFISGKQDPRVPGKEISIELVPFAYSLDDFKYSYKVTDQEIEEQDRFIKKMSANEKQALFYKLTQRGMAKMQKKADMEKEYLQSSLATNSTNYPAENVYTVVNKWDNPATNIQAEFDTVITKAMGVCGVEPNKVLLSYDVFKALKSHPNVVDLIKYSMKGIVTKELLAEVIGVDEVIVGAASYRMDEVATKQFFWSDCAIFWYQPPSASGGEEEPYFGMRMQNEGYPKVKTWRQEPDFNFWTLYKCYINALLPSPGGVLVDVPLT